VAGERFSAADVYVASLLDFGMAFNLIARKPEFEAYVGPLLARPARKRADALIQELMAKDVVAAL
jgi:glutathione S-transferase